MARPLHCGTMLNTGELILRGFMLVNIKGSLLNSISKQPHPLQQFKECMRGCVTAKCINTVNCKLTANCRGQPAVHHPLIQMVSKE